MQVMLVFRLEQLLQHSIMHLFAAALINVLLHEEILQVIFSMPELSNSKQQLSFNFPINNYTCKQP